MPVIASGNIQDFAGDRTVTEHSVGLTETQVKRFRPIAHRLAGQFVKWHGGFRNDDQEDIAQELMTAVTEGIHRHDPSRSTLATYVDRLMRYRGISLIRKSNAAKRDWKRNGRSQDDDHNGECRCGCGFDERAARRHTDIERRSDEERAQLRLDVSHVLESQPKSLRVYARLLMDGLSHEAARRKLGRSRREAERDRTALLRLFEDKRLQDYL